MNTIDQKKAVRRIHSCGNNYYKMLDVPQNATEAQILMSFKKMAKKVHPDKNFDPRATETFQDLLKAKNVLMDSTMRKDFDQKLRCSYGETRWNRWGNSKRSGRSNGGSNGGLDAGRSGGRFSSFKPQWAFIVLIIFVLIIVYLFSIPSYSLISSEKFPLKCTTTNIKVPYYLPQNRDCFTKYKPLGNLWEIMVVNNFWNTMRHACNAEMHYRDTLLEYARKMQMPSCDKLDFLQTDTTKFIFDN